LDFFFLGTPRGGRGFRFTAGWNAGVWGRVEYLLFLHFSSLFFAFLILFLGFKREEKEKKRQEKEKKRQEKEKKSEEKTKKSRKIPQRQLYVDF